MSLVGASGMYRAPDGSEQAALVLADHGGSVDLAVFTLEHTPSGTVMGARYALGVIVVDPYGHSRASLMFTPQPPEMLQP